MCGGLRLRPAGTETRGAACSLRPPPAIRWQTASLRRHPRRGSLVSPPRRQNTCRGWPTSGAIIAPRPRHPLVVIAGHPWPRWVPPPPASDLDEPGAQLERRAHLAGCFKLVGMKLGEGATFFRLDQEVEKSCSRFSFIPPTSLKRKVGGIRR